MQVKQATTGTTVTLTVNPNQAQIMAGKHEAVQRLGKNLKLQGFRPGKAPIALIEKNLDPNVLQSEFLDIIVNHVYLLALQAQKVRPVTQPEVSILKFVPYGELEIQYQVEAIGDIKLPDYTKIKITKPPVKVVAKDIDDVIDNLRSRGAAKETVTRAAKDGDEVVLDFSGVDASSHAPIAGAEGTDYPLVLGSNSFIPGFEAEVVGLKAGDSKDFTITFPADYGSVELQSKVVVFTIKVHKVLKVVLAKVDDAFAASVGPFTTFAELRADIEKQLLAEKTAQAERDYDNELLEAMAKKTTVTIPKVLVDDEIDRIEAEEKRNLVYRGQTWAEHLAAEGVSEDEHREKNRVGADLRVRAGLVLAEIAEQQHITVPPEELDMHVQLLKNQYTDPSMQAEIDQPANRREIASRLLSEKTIAAVKLQIAQK
ncbi:MAG: trigger factor [Candidatus Saccharibacteria bacterium]